MAIYGIADLHLDFSKKKPMDIFGKNWINHEEKIFENWKKVIGEHDLVLMPGDISWAMKLNEVKLDLERIDELPGLKVISKGNHDYWWQTKSKLNSLKLDTIHFLHNDSYVYKNIAICGARGWTPRDSEEFKEHDEKIFNREVSRLKLSLSSVNGQGNKKIVMLHYPPFNIDGTANEFVEVMKEYNVSICVYGHLHADGHRFVVEGNIEGIEFYCISSDYIDFKARKILEI
ncbi:metallophosphoesterase [Caldisalinibacter kiritimatiensis]|uniref:Putative phosphohydrolase n=1 Tax=Caldisalinibacter kiritimatiensis TaxID=1304284 RepID=R1CEY7_9FIRM|nr:metallophosphoesterase [Caldisalinibacter kiritimatiensis]EOD00870.1 Putative phosphohydrolase [Caldisalinibacter kiritimatiensis]